MAENHIILHSGKSVLYLLSDMVFGIFFQYSSQKQYLTINHIFQFLKLHLSPRVIVLSILGPHLQTQWKNSRTMRLLEFYVKMVSTLN